MSRPKNPPLPPAMIETALGHRVEYREALKAEHGVKCAAWLVAEHRRFLRRGGVIEMLIPRKSYDALPFWFVLAVEVLHERGWAVERTQDRKYIRWRIRRRALYNVATANDSN